MLFEVAQPGGQPEDVHLAAGVIDVILARHIPAGKGQQAGQRRAIGGTATVADVQRAGRIGRDELDLHRSCATELRAPVVLPVNQHGTDDIDLGPRIEREIDEPGPGKLGLGDQRRHRQLGQQLAGNFARVLLQRLGQLHRQIGREVAVRRVARTFEVNWGVGCSRRNAGQRLLQELGQLGFDVMGH